MAKIHKKFSHSKQLISRVKIRCPLRTFSILSLNKLRFEKNKMKFWKKITKKSATQNYWFGEWKFIFQKYVFSELRFQIAVSLGFVVQKETPDRSVSRRVFCQVWSGGVGLKKSKPGHSTSWATAPPATPPRGISYCPGHCTSWGPARSDST